MNNVPNDRRYTKTHEWVQITKDAHIIKIGITDHAQSKLGDVVFVELPIVGHDFQPKDTVAVIESVKTATDIYMPIAGEVIAINKALADNPDFINEDPYNQGWIYTIKAKEAGAKQYHDLLDAEQYQASIQGK